MKKITAALTACIIALLLFPFNAFSETAKLKGDVNGDNVVDAVDAAEILSYYTVQQTSLTGIPYDVYLKHLEIYDLNGDQTIDANDASAVLEHYVRTQTMPDLNKMTSESLMKNITPLPLTGQYFAADEDFIRAQSNFAIELFKSGGNSEENLLISPLSVMLALSMTANGADGKTLAEMETVLGGGMSMENLNKYLYYYINNLVNEERASINIGNAIWYRDAESLDVNRDFLQKNLTYYNAEAYKAPFNESTKNDINNWIDVKTDGMIKDAIDKIDPQAVMYLVNALLFEADWANKYTDYQVSKGQFTNSNGNKEEVEFMYSDEYRYVSDGNATGFIKPYINGYSMLTLLPNGNVSIDDYIAGLTGEKFIGLVKNAKSALIKTAMPKFESEFSVEMSDILKKMGIVEAFDWEHANFRNMMTDALGNIFINRVIHKTAIKVDQKGTKAAAVTIVEVATCSIPPQPDYYITLDRPFVYAIIDNATGLPIFIGTTLSVK